MVGSTFLWVIIAQSKYERMLYLRSFKIFSFKIFTDILNKVNFTNAWLQVHIHFIFREKGSIFPAIYDCSKQKFCKLAMNMGTMKLFPFLLTFFRQLVLWEDIFTDILPSTSSTGRYIRNSCFFDSLFCSKYIIIK